MANDLKLNNVASKVKLFGDGTGETGGGQAIEILFQHFNSTLAANGSIKSGYLYIPESYSSNHSFTLTVDNKERIGYTSTTFKRNHIYPFVINLRNYKLDITISYEAPPIGGIVKPVETVSGGYNIPIKEGSTFTLKAKLMKADESVTVTKWNISEIKNNIPIENLQQCLTDAASITGSIPAQPTARTTVVTLEADDTEGGKHAFELTISVAGLEIRSAIGSSFPVITLPQVLGMY
ncbi:MAG: hypothetical protein LUD46_21385 [Parabacteroides sp.]|nr:hypothetical protein [Parabacteroides sp.]